MDRREEIRRQLTGPGGPFEICQEEVLGECMPVFRRRPSTLRDLLAESGVHGAKEYLVQGKRRISYAENLRRAAAAARVLSERYGVGKGDRVAILAANCAEWVTAFWAAVSLGGIVAALNGWWTADEIRFGIEDAEPRLLIGDRRRLARLEGRDPGVPVLEIESEFAGLLEPGPAELPTTPLAEDDPAVILYTSGTTGRPKGALASHRGIVGFVQTASLAGLESVMMDAATTPAEEGPARPAEAPCALVTVPLFHLSGLYAMVVMHLAIGAKLVLREGRFDPEDVLRLIERERVTTWSALGSMGPRVAAVPHLQQFDLSSVQNVGFGGAPVSRAVQERVRKIFPNARANLGMGYGSSESVTAVATIRGGDYQQNPDAAGRVVPTHDLQIRGPSGEVLPEGEEGEIFVHSPYVMLGYWRRPDATREALQPGRWLATGDIGRLVGGLLYVNSRARDLILRSAENVYPVEIEHRLEQHPDVQEAAVVGVDHEELGQEVKAIVVPAQGTRPDPEALARFCGETLAPFKVPTLWELRSEPLPRNAAGKVLKNVLRGERPLTFVEE